MRQVLYSFTAVLSILFVSLFFLHVHLASAQSVSDLQSRIDQRNSDIEALEREIAGYQKQINALGTQANSLSATIKSLELTQKKLEADIKVTENKVAAKNLEIRELGIQIGNKEETIAYDRKVIAHSLSLMNQRDTRSVPEILLGSRSFSAAWNAVDELSTLQAGLVDRVNQLRALKANLETNRKDSEKARAELLDLTGQLKDQRQVAVNTKAEQNEILKETKQSEAQYQKLLAEKKALKEKFEREVFEYESRLRLAVDASKLPSPGKGVLSWPLDNVHITQYFGNTEFATKNPQIYNGKGHTGIDLRASIGTPVRSALSGVVVGMGNTDAVRGCYSYGKWVMVKHPNGLSTLYAHLSVQSVSQGDGVSTGEVIGYSGNTGYSTGPHLHFGVYATEGVQIKTFDNSVNCKGALIPLADFKAYLNPLSYL